MRTKTVVIIIALVGIFFASCNKNEALDPSPDYIWLNENGKNLVQSSTNFGFDLLKQIAINESQKENWMISPLSVSLALAMTYNGANGDTKTAFENTLKLNDLTIDEININYKQIVDALLNLDDNVELSIANSIWYRNTFSVLQNFIDVNTDFYDATVRAIDFEMPSAKDEINSWVSNNTSHKIETIIDEINAESVMFLINAIYFSGRWKYQFDPTENTWQPFTCDDGAIKSVEMMHLTADLKRFSNQEITMVELSYGRGNWVMDLILPSEGRVNELISGIISEEWQDWVKGLSEPIRTNLTLPPYKFDYDATLNPVLASLGMNVVFNPNTADFSKINTDGQIFISNVKHKTVIEVNEAGTEAAAATSVEIGLTSAGNENIVFNKPFLFIIREISTNTILFMGKVGAPER